MNNISNIRETTRTITKIMTLMISHTTTANDVTIIITNIIMITTTMTNKKNVGKGTK